MLGGTLYLVGIDAKSGELVANAAPCALCKRFIINAGIVRVVVRNTDDSFTVINVSEWIENDDSENVKFGY